MLSVLHFEAAGDSIVRLAASRALSHCKHDIGTLLWLNAGTLERVPNPLFNGFVRCSAHGHSFARLWYYHGKIYTLASYILLYQRSSGKH